MTAPLQPTPDVQIREVLRDLLEDYGGCDRPETCQCSAARARRLLAGLEAENAEEQIVRVRLVDVQALADLPWQDLGGHLTCGEADEAVPALRRLGFSHAADLLLEDHVECDQPEDRHWRPNL